MPFFLRKNSQNCRKFAPLIIYIGTITAQQRTLNSNSESIIKLSMQKRYVNSTHTPLDDKRLIEIKDASISYEDNEAVLDHINMHVEQGEFVYIIGRVGSGKSSLLKAIYAELEFDNGEANVLGHDLMKLKRRHIPELRRKMGIVFQDYALLHTHSVQQNLDFVLRATEWKKKEERESRIKEVLEQVGLTDKEGSFPHELSGGEQQRVAIARALLNSPRLILADEPTGNLDAATARSIIDLMKSFSMKGTAVVLITHNMSHLKHCPGRVYECENNTIREIRHNSSDSEMEMNSNK